MTTSLQGQRALVTGSTTGIGYAIAAELARAGAEVIINGHTQPRVDQALQSLQTTLGAGATLNGAAADAGSAAGAGTDRAVRRRRHPGQQRRYIRRAAVPRIARRGLAEVL